MQDIYSPLLLISLSAIGIAFLYLAFLRYEVAIFLVVFSPWTPFIIYQNTHDAVLLEEASVGSYIRIAIIIGMGIVGIVKFFQYLPSHKGRLPLHFLLMAGFLLLAFISTIYSLDPDITFIRSATLSAFFCFLLGLYAWIREEADLFKALNTLYYLILLFIILSILGMVFMPSRVWWWNLTTRFIGIWGHPNTTGMFCLVSYPVLIWKFNESSNYRKILIAGLLLFVLYMHIITGSRTSLFAAAIGVCVWFLFQKQAIKVVATAAVMALFIFLLLEFKPESYNRVDSSSITDVTGRDQFWDGAMLLIKEQPIRGYGFAVEGKIWEDPRFFKEGYDLWSGSNKASLHNGYLSITIGMGIPGLIYWLAILIIPFILIFRAKSSYYKSFAGSVIVMMLVSNFAESIVNSANSIGAVFFWIAWLISGKLYKLDNDEETADEQNREELNESYAA